MKKHKGLNKHGKIVATALENLSAIALAECGLTVKTIARATGLTPSQVVYRYRKAGISPMDYRRGMGPMADTILETYAVETANDDTYAELIEDYAGFLGFEPPFKQADKTKTRKAKKDVAA